MNGHIRGWIKSHIWSKTKNRELIPVFNINHRLRLTVRAEVGLGLQYRRRLPRVLPRATDFAGATPSCRSEFAAVAFCRDATWKRSKDS